ncbi:MAG: TIGR00282 family metallophosphoesterase [Rickettsiales bacterium]|nr:TIGR00282 family metallophosphoesterase [Rickettsiales bacterium]|tara:strand:- start:48 stop:851 length:804 start_codon:yes stop_codon:yes gene_type:complete
MKILICGDIVGKSGRQIVQEQIPFLIKKKKIDFVVVNGENAANGFGITKKICNDLYSSGVDVITSGNHIWDQKEIIEHIECDKRLLRPCNYPVGTPGLGYGAYELKDGSTVVVINVMCRLFMDVIDDPFKSVDEILTFIDKKISNAIIILDIHGESTSEKMALAHFFDGRLTAVVGTHTHIPTADQHILEKGTFYQTDLGMCGDYDSVIGMKKSLSIQKFTNKFLKSRLETATGQGTLCGALIEIDNQTKIVNGFSQVIIGGKLNPS